MKKRTQVSLNKIVVLHNPDKKHNESWTADRASKNIGNFPSPFRCTIVADVGKGKTGLIKNLIMSQFPMFRQVFLVHPDAEVSREYDDLECTEVIDYLPELEFFNFEDDGEAVKRCIIIDDWEWSKLSKIETKNLGLLMRYASSHKNLSVIIANQSFFDLPSIIRKMSNIFVIYKPTAKTELTMIENRVGCEPGYLREMFKTVADGHYDSICIDLIKDTPAKYRKNIFEIIEAE
jgi:hypothetical protein